MQAQWHFLWEGTLNWHLDILSLTVQKNNFQRLSVIEASDGEGKTLAFQLTDKVTQIAPLGVIFRHCHCQCSNSITPETLSGNVHRYNLIATSESESHSVRSASVADITCIFIITSLYTPEEETVCAFLLSIVFLHPTSISFFFYSLFSLLCLI